MNVKFSFDEAAIKRQGYALDDVHRTIKNLFAAYDLSCISEGEVISFEDKDHGDDFACMWEIIMALLRTDWFVSCASSCVWQDGDSYVLNGDKTDSHILTAHQNCDPGHEYQQMMETKQAVGKLDGRQCYHIIQSFKPGEVSPELALEIAKEFASEYLPDYEVIIGTHIDRGHIHSHIVFNSVNAQTVEKYHIPTQEYYRQIRAISDRLCRAHGLSVIMEGQPTFRSMLKEETDTVPGNTKLCASDRADRRKNSNRDGEQRKEYRSWTLAI